MGALSFEAEEIPSSPANWSAYCYALGRRYVLWMRQQGGGSRSKSSGLRFGGKTG
jgi:hypothetical protein